MLGVSMIELRQFRQFIAVAEELSFRRAAERLGMAQPPLTAAIRNIEEELGVLLIERTNRVTGLTNAGQVFLDEGRRAVAQAERALRATRRVGEGLIGSLRITFVASAANDFLPRVLRAFQEHHADVELELTEATTAQQATVLLEDRADIGILVPPVWSDGLTFDVLVEDELVAVVPAEHPLSPHGSVPLSALADQPWVLFPAHQGRGLYSRIIMACAQAGFTPRVVQHALHMETIVGLVAGGIGVALVPRSLSIIGRRNAVFLHLTGAGAPIKYELAAAYRRHSPLLDAFLGTARAKAMATLGVVDPSTTATGA
jgi:DNA-binding transcriptional LysR family regulator